MIIISTNMLKTGAFQTILQMRLIADNEVYPHYRCYKRYFLNRKLNISLALTSVHDIRAPRPEDMVKHEPNLITVYTQ